MTHAESEPSEEDFDRLIAGVLGLRGLEWIGDARGQRRWRPGIDHAARRLFVAIGRCYPV
jgi:hypothetical protein